MKEKISLLYKMLIVLVGGYALYINFKLLTFSQGILYFTNISNLLCFIYFLVLVILKIAKKDKDSDAHYIIKGAVTMSIALTMFVYNAILSSNASMSVFDGHQLETSLVHIVVPLLVIFDYIIFGKKGHLKKHYPLIWSTVLIAYMIFIYSYIGFGGVFIDNAKYPYPFMDVSNNGFIGVVGIICIIIFVYLGFGYVVQTIDNKLSKRKK